TSLVVATDTFGFADANVAAALQPMVQRLAALIGHSREDIMAPQGLSVWARAQRTLQPVEAWNTFKDWLDERNPRFAFSVARQLLRGSHHPADRAELGGADAPGSARPHGPSAAAGHHPVPAAHAVSRAAGEAAAVRARPGARSHHLPLLAGRIGRASAGQPA